MRSSVRAVLAVIALVGAVVTGFVAMVSGPASASDSASAPASDSGPVQVTDAVLRWGINNESNNSAFDGSANIFSAGKAPDTGGGKLRESQWSQASGNTEIQKWNGTDWQPATWAGLFTSSSGGSIQPPTSGVFSNHNLVISGGTGTVDIAAGTAQVAWTGSATVLYYQGLSEFYLSDPVLDITDGSGTLTATVQGYAASRDGTSAWALQDPATVTLATLTGVDLSDPRGFVVTPTYDGSFPADFVAYMETLGTGTFWKASGGITDNYKTPLPLTISYDATAVVTPTPSEQSSAAVPDPPTLITPPASSQTPSSTPTQSSTPTATATDTQSIAVPGVIPPVEAASPSAAPSQTPQPNLPAPVSAVRADPPATTLAAAPIGGSTSWPWWAGSALLLAAAGLVLLPTRRHPRDTRTP